MHVNYDCVQCETTLVGDTVSQGSHIVWDALAARDALVVQHTIVFVVICWLSQYGCCPETQGGSLGLILKSLFEKVRYLVQARKYCPALTA